MNARSSDTVQKSLELKHRLAKLTQDSLNFEVMKIQLEEDIDAQQDMKIEMKNQNAKTRKLISRMITKTQKYLVESEKLIMDKIFEVQQMQTKLAESEQDRQIHYDRREYA